jgi:hypothetical protein
LASVNHFEVNYDSKDREGHLQRKLILFAILARGMIRRKHLTGTMIKSKISY